MIYYIYEVIGEKNGATVNWDKRSQENFDMYGIHPILIETMEGPDTPEMWQIVGDREWELADLNGYRKGTHYRVAREARIQAGILTGNKNRESGHIQILSSYRSKESYQGPKPWLKKLTQEQVNNILIDTDSLRVIAKKYKVSHITISNIKKPLIS